MKLLTVTALVAALFATGALAQPGRGWHDNDHRGWVRDYGDGGHHWRRGERMGWNDWSRGERVDWRARRLRAPPRGYEWRRVGDQYVLAAVATGVIASIILNAGR